MDKYESLFGRGGLSLDRLRNFVLVAQAGGISRAAKGEPTRMSLFSKQIRELETFFGAALTQRQGRLVRLTEAGNRLAQLAQSHLSSLEDFQQTCQDLPQTLSLGAANSVLEWMVMPRMTRVREALPNTRFTFYSGRTKELVSQVSDMTLDFALVREDAVSTPLKSRRVATLTYALFLPAKLAKGVTPGNLKSALARLPLATSMGGQFLDQLTGAAQKANWPLQIDLACTSYTQAARACEAGGYGAILPTIAATQMHLAGAVMLPLEFMKVHTRNVCLVWHPRLAEMRTLVSRAQAILPRALS